MSTTYLSIYDLLRIAYTYESQALVAEGHKQGGITVISSCPTPEICKNVGTSSCYDALETDFTQKYARRKRNSCVSMS
ncbi:hypothetical protein PMIN01_03482 [Paraphaeosphaeria minitans]|uniref:Uncharacterized protein n=1 Tax=Paraphaeosphaeria minitans TaxID=565426 RepID=A0A9P6GQ69_9PLEO|nr:hypothetical protein PMIN01_03482 [Paraphaeosphaeria minitans]